MTGLAPPRDYAARADQVFGAAAASIDADCNTMMADHSAKGRLQSGATIIEATRIWEERSAAALDTLQAEFAAIVETRGREWQRAMTALNDALVRHGAEAPATLAKPFKIAMPDGQRGQSVAKAAQARIDEAVERLASRLAAFRDGWTAPRPRKWNERHPFLYAVALALIGAVLALGGKALAG